MNMLTSLKALLFPATAVGQAPTAIAGAAEGIDFSALLNGVTDMLKAAAGQAPAPAKLDAEAAPAPSPLTGALPPDRSSAPLPLPVPPVTVEVAPPVDGAPQAAIAAEIQPPMADQAAGEVSEPLVPAPVAMDAALPDSLPPSASEPMPATGTTPKPNNAAAQHQAGASAGLAMSRLDEGTIEEAVGERDTGQQDDAPLGHVHDAQPKDVATPQLVPPLPVPLSNVAAAAPSAASAGSVDVKDAPTERGSGSIPAVPTKSGGVLSRSDDASSTASPLEGAGTVVPTATAIAPSEDSDVKAVGNGSLAGETPAAPRNSEPQSRRIADAPSPPAPTQAMKTDLQTFQAASAPIVSAQPGAGVAPAMADARMSAQERPVPSGMDDIRATHAASRPSIAEALSLLQLARDQLHDRTGDRSPALPERSSDPAVATPTGTDRPFMPLMSQHVVMSQGTAQLFAAPAVVDLSASLGAQVVDMGISGQWIDGLARDIASFSADGAQGRFRIDAGQLGPVQVDIRQGVDGAAVSLTVASDVAEQMLRQEGDRLKLDAGLAAVRISDVKVERAHIVSEPSRSDGAGAQSSGQQSTGSQSQGGAWTMQGQGWGQSSAQSHMQGRGQGRENFGATAKSGGDPAVLNHEQSGGHAVEPPRARYA
ncbi:flagellar hook-length control protein FliK [Sphingobium sp. CCH11-B1]|jgi:hypothetical protein|uniref:flagellar hook-length control protein FliK n=1 Tax=Sphingobium sp. CCH11-B1 TaxID=1768781 RepID=UPI000834D36E|nr:flagellar hook-length control protein FliK [Sphingobium sp. CCH11-B1]MEA3387707.1 flagellar hook-length control protein FliK [Pseudomonadota bacterium]